MNVHFYTSTIKDFFVKEVKEHSNLVWIDLEFSGLELESNVILEIATIVTDGELNILTTGPCYAIRQPAHIVENMDHWNTKHHNASGLVDKVKNSKITEAIAEQETLEFLFEYTVQGQAPLCGNSIHQDRRFLERYMPRLHRHFHYRNVDVSTVKELAKRWNPEIKEFSKSGAHRALEDIQASIEELKYYRQHFIK